MPERPILITSGAYIGEEMQAEFGRIPPTFLPVGSKYLLQHQLERLRGHQDVWLSLPIDFEMDQAQANLVDQSGIQIVRIDPTKSLGMSVFQSILEVGMERGIEIIHGDTLYALDETSADAVSVATVRDQYAWGSVDLDGDTVSSIGQQTSFARGNYVLSGYFALSDAEHFLKCLSRADFSFVAALHDYAQQETLVALKDTEALDFGHLKTFYSSRHSMAAARHFNAVEIDGYTVTKRSEDASKIDAEAAWLRSVPASIQPFTVRLIEEEGTAPEGYYRTLYANYPSLSELYLARAPKLVWEKVLGSCVDYLSRAADAAASSGGNDTLRWLAIEKLERRYAAYPGHLPDGSTTLSINNETIGTRDQLTKRIADIITDAPTSSAAIMHGDFCFSNILFDMRAERILLIDPRGLVDGKPSLHGDLRYDIAKLGHSILGRYDQIVAGQIVASKDGSDFSLEVDTDPRRRWLDKKFRRLTIAGIDFDDPVIHATIISLFLSMIPLHADAPERQSSLFANALRLAKRWELA